MSDSTHSQGHSVVPKKYFLTFVLVTILFPLWGFANDITNPMVAAFKNILLLTNFESSMVQAAFYGGYALMAIPAALYIRRFSYRAGILLGLGLYACGCLLFIPSGWTLAFAPFLLAYLIMTCGLSFLETTANPYILSLGHESTATRRLNFSQAFNPMGSITGMFVASMFILANLDGTTESARRAMNTAKEGNLVHAQVAESLNENAKKISTIVSKSGWENNKRDIKSATELIAQQVADASIIASPHPDQARSLSTELAAQPSDNRFVEAGHAIAVVLQIRDKAQPTATEQKITDLFGSGNGLELSLLLADEMEVPAVMEARNQVTESLTLGADAARKLEQAIKDKDVAQAKEHASAMTAAFANVKSFASIPDKDLTAYREKMGERFRAIQQHDLDIVVGPYAIMGTVLLLMLGLFIWKLPKSTEQEDAAKKEPGAKVGETLKRLGKQGNYLGGIVAQTFYVGAQIMCWTFIIQYAALELGLSKSTAQNCNILAMIIFVSSRFICTFFLKYIRPGRLLFLLAVGGITTTLGTIFLDGYLGLYSLIATSACMSLMFPTIYGIALDGLGQDAKLASAGLILAIGGGCIMTPLQGLIIDQPAFDIGFRELSSVRASFALPTICFIVIAIYGWLALGHQIKKERLVEGESYTA